MVVSGTLTADGIYTLQEACTFLRISDATARRWIKDGRLPARKIGRDYRVLGRDLLRCLNTSPTPEHEIELRPSYPDHPLLELAGIGDSGRSDIAEEHDRYLNELHRAKP